MYGDHQFLTDEEIDPIRKRVAAATPGPWECDQLGNVNGPDTGFGELRVATLESCARRENVVNGEFIANARADMMRLLDEVEQYKNGFWGRFAARKSRECREKDARIAILEAASKTDQETPGDNVKIELGLPSALLDDLSAVMVVLGKNQSEIVSAALMLYFTKVGWCE